MLISTNCDESIFVRGVSHVGRNARSTPQQGLDFADRNAVTLALRPISLVPIKPVNYAIHREI
jgi:hypothetical protein